jgi:hypothetical protein
MDRRMISLAQRVFDGGLTHFAAPGIPGLHLWQCWFWAIARQRKEELRKPIAPDARLNGSLGWTVLRIRKRAVSGAN